MRAILATDPKPLIQPLGSICVQLARFIRNTDETHLVRPLPSVKKTVATQGRDGPFQASDTVTDRYLLPVSLIQP
jgi:hypothetical protein